MNIKCQRGQEHTDVKGNVRKGRNIKGLKNCDTGCKYLCKKITAEDKENIFKGF